MTEDLAITDTTGIWVQSNVYEPGMGSLGVGLRLV